MQRSVLLLTMSLLGRCLTSSPVVKDVDKRHYEFIIIVQQLSPTCGSEPVQQRVRLVVRGIDGARLAETWTAANGYGRVNFVTSVKPEQIEATVGDHAAGHFTGSIVSVGRERTYCIVIPPGCLL